MQPAPLGGEIARQGAWTFRIAREGPLRVLQELRAAGWEDLYAFEPAERYPIDFEVSNWYTSTWPESRFVLSLTAQRYTTDARRVLRNLTYTEDRNGSIDTQTIAREDLVSVLRERFDLDVPDDARFRALD
jgi:N-hydroxyarylamine O-acetyltransferase